MARPRLHTHLALSRRQFLAGAAVAPLVVPRAVLGGTGKTPPSDQTVLGSIGVGGRGSFLLRNFLPIPQARVVAVCDPNGKRREARKRQIDTHYAEAVGKAVKGCAGYRDFRKLLDRSDIDAVVCATPGQWHGLHYVMAAKAGKDIYGEKPLTLTAAEGRAVCDTVRRYGRVFQTGLQQRSEGRFRLACELARNGCLGKLHAVKVGVPGGATLPDAPTVPVPEGFDYDLWLGPAPATPYNEVKCQGEHKWGHIYDYSLGFLAAWGVHHLDIARWGAPSISQGQVRLEGTGTFPTEGMANTPLTWRVELTADDGVRLSFADLTTHEMGCRFEGDKGWVHVNREIIKGEPEAILKDGIRPGDTRLYESENHAQNFLDCIRSRRDTAAPAEVGHGSTLLTILSDIAIRTGRKLTWDWKAERFVGDDEANRRLARAMRPPWSL